MKRLIIGIIILLCFVNLYAKEECRDRRKLDDLGTKFFRIITFRELGIYYCLGLMDKEDIENQQYIQEQLHQLSRNFSCHS